MTASAVFLTGVSAQSPAEDADAGYVLEVDEKGDAVFTYRLNFSLRNETSREAFRSLREDETTRDEIRIRFRDRMQWVVDGVDSREMSVTDSDVVYRTGNETGYLSVSVKISNLGATRRGAVIITEPFASGFEPDARLTVIGPQEYENVSVTPNPDRIAEKSVRYDAGRNLSGFNVTFTTPLGDNETTTDNDTDGQPEEDAGEGQPGFGVGVVLIAFAISLMRVST